MADPALPVLLAADALLPRNTQPLERDRGDHQLRVGSRVLVLPVRSSDAADLALGLGTVVGEVATLGRVVATTKTSLEVHGVARVRITAQSRPHQPLRARWELIEEHADAPEVLRLADLDGRLVRRLQSHWDKHGLADVDSRDQDPARFAFRIAQSADFSEEQRRQALRATDLADLLRQLRRWLREVTPPRSRGRRPSRAVTVDTAPKAGSALTTVPARLREAVERELEAGNEQIQDYIEKFPWADPGIPDLNLSDVARRLDAAHFGMEGAKQAFLGYLRMAAFRRGRGLPPQGQTFLLVGPPGVGKTSFCQALAQATGRIHIRLSIGSESDDIRLLGCSRSWHGSDTGEICRGLIRAQTRYVLLQLDEIDKQLRTDRGQNILATLLALTDPVQNAALEDVYLRLPMDLSPALIVFSANDLEAVSSALRDRCTAIELSGYTQEEKEALLASHLLPHLLADNGIAPHSFGLTEAARSEVVSRHPGEPGVRGITRDLTTLLTAALPRLEEGSEVTIGVDQVIESLGDAPPPSLLPLHPPPGQALALGVSGAGSARVVPVQVQCWPGCGCLETSGQLGPAFLESISTALAYLRVHGAEVGIDPALLSRVDLHLHLVSPGSNDGASAGLAIVCAIVSAVTDRPLPGDMALTGAIDLYGAVLPVGDLPKKLAAARAAGLQPVVPAASRFTAGGGLGVEVGTVREAIELLFGRKVRPPLPRDGEAARHLGAAGGVPDGDHELSPAADGTIPGDARAGHGQPRSHHSTVYSSRVDGPVRDLGCYSAPQVSGAGAWDPLRGGPIADLTGLSARWCRVRPASHRATTLPAAQASDRRPPWGVLP
jgi:ATP-dependent Lon protease